MEYWIDGYNLLFYLSENENSFQTLREKLLSMLHENYSHKNLTIIFDATHQEDELQHVTDFHSFTIVYTPAKMTADAYIVERLTHEHNPKTITVVSSDKGLLKHSLYQGAKTQTLPSFLNEYKKDKPPSSEKPSIDSDYELDRLLKIFEKRSEDH